MKRMRSRSPSVQRIVGPGHLAVVGPRRIEHARRHLDLAILGDELVLPQRLARWAAGRPCRSRSGSGRRWDRTSRERAGPRSSCRDGSPGLRPGRCPPAPAPEATRRLPPAARPTVPRAPAFSSSRRRRLTLSDSASFASPTSRKVPTSSHPFSPTIVAATLQATACSRRPLTNATHLAPLAGEVDQRDHRERELQAQDHLAQDQQAGRRPARRTGRSRSRPGRSR